MSSFAAIQLDDRTAWDAALEGIPHCYAHTWEGCAALSGEAQAETYLWSAAHAGERFACVVRERSFGGRIDAVTPYGFPGFVGSAPGEGLAQLWRRFAVNRGYVCAYLVLNPVLSDADTCAGLAQRHRTVYVVDLRRGEGELYARLSQNRKREVRTQATTVVDDEGLAAFFVATYPDFVARRDAAAAYDLSPESLWGLCESGSTFLVGTRQGGEIVAAALFAATPYLGDYVFGISAAGQSGHSGALVWAGVLELRRRGVPFLNLGGGVVEGDGVEGFKRRFGADELPLLIVKEVYDSAAYGELCETVGVDPSREAAYFPAYRSPGHVASAPGSA
jgi:hypothetical protein